MTVTASRDEPSDSASYAGPTGFDGTLTIQLSLAKTLSRRLNPRNARSVMPIVRYAQ